MHTISAVNKSIPNGPIVSHFAVPVKDFARNEKRSYTP